MADQITGTGARRGKLFVLTAPSGAGKTTLTKALLADNPDLRFSVSFTTRAPRPGEQDGRDYFFVDRARFEAMIAAGRAARVRAGLRQLLRHRPGADRAASRAPAGTCCSTSTGRARGRCAPTWPESVLIFIMPPSLAELERRLRGRATDSDEVIRRRLSEALADMGHWDEFDYVVINDDVAPRAGRAARDHGRDGIAPTRPADPALRRQLGRHPVPGAAPAP